LFERSHSDVLVPSEAILASSARPYLSIQGHCNWLALADALGMENSILASMVRDAHKDCLFLTQQCSKQNLCVLENRTLEKNMWTGWDMQKNTHNSRRKILLFTCLRASSSRDPSASSECPPFASACRRKERTSHDGELPHKHRQLCCKGGNGHVGSSFRWRWGRRDGHRGRAFRSTCEALRGHSS